MVNLMIYSDEVKESLTLIELLEFWGEYKDSISRKI